MGLLISVMLLGVLGTAPGPATEVFECGESLRDRTTRSTIEERATAPPPLSATVLQSAVLLEYSSAYDVHTAYDPNRPIRSQPGSFNVPLILDAVAPLVSRPEAIDFVLIYSLVEVPGWIHSGNAYGSFAKNIGFYNDRADVSPPTGWDRLRGVPHMNDLAFAAQESSGEANYYSALIPIHEMGHRWLVRWSADSPGPRDWDDSMPVAWLAGCCLHWSWNWDHHDNGIMYSGPQSPRFNAFDLYGIGLMSYSEADTFSYDVWECTPSECFGAGPRHTVKLRDLQASLEKMGPGFYEGDGRRDPPLDESVESVQVLIVVIKGIEDELTSEDLATVTKIATDLPPAWSTATWGRSRLVVRAKPRRRGVRRPN